jgi:poly(A) polymerase
MSRKIQDVSNERVRDEILKILTEGGAPQGVKWLFDTGLMEWVIPETLELEGTPQPPEFHPEGDVLVHTLIMLGMMRAPTPELAMGVLLHDVGKPRTIAFSDRIRFNNHMRVGAEMATEICRRLRFSFDQTAHIARLVSEHHQFMHVKQMRESRFKRFLRMDRFSEHLELHRLDCLSSHGDLENYEFCRSALEHLSPDEIRPIALISGKDLISMGYVPGPAFKVVLSRLEDAQMDGLIQHREGAIEMAKLVFKEMGLTPQADG